uniref:ATP synthase subunit a n=1 Tax=Ryssota otaheitana TaxID=2595071 RepID=A0A5B8G756_9EUPU|nr:ATP synthase F0 subunit 6 [Ryssota otaheitana]QDM39461.1 ATP synthase F0 subunit 6 [Ryssota otaheitana]
MMVDLFSSMDGMNTFKSWGIMGASLVLMNFMYSRVGFIFLFAKVSSLWVNKNDYWPMVPMFFSSMMMFIIINNVIGLFPYTYGVTSSLWFCSTMAICFWFCLLMSGFSFYPKKAVAHLLPSGAPFLLVPFLIIIETISIIIRPITLTVRLVANISAGHIVLTLMYTALSGSLSFMPLVFINVLAVGYMLFEVFVCFVQAYIFTLLISLYASEHP